MNPLKWHGYGRALKPWNKYDRPHLRHNLLMVFSAKYRDKIIAYCRAYEAGAKAYRSGESSGSSPYRQGSMEDGYWTAGWNFIGPPFWYEGPVAV